MPGWFDLFKHLEGGTSTTQAISPLSAAKESLEPLRIESISNLIVTASLMSPVRPFQNLAYLSIGAYCHNKNGKGHYTFRLNNNSITKISMALPCFEALLEKLASRRKPASKEIDRHLKKVAQMEPWEPQVLSGCWVDREGIILAVYFSSSGDIYH